MFLKRSFFIFSMLLLTFLRVEGQIISVKTKLGSRNLNPNRIQLGALEDNLIIEWKPCSNCTYRYWLRGLDQDTVVYAYPVARFTKLGGGSYTFQVQTKQNSQWSKPLTLGLDVETSLTETLWFWPSMAVYALLLLGAAIYFFLLYNFRQKLKLHSLRNRIAADLHDEVGATLSSIAISTHLIAKKWGNQTPDMLSILNQIKSDSEDTIQVIRDTVWTLNSDNDSAAQLFEKMRSLAFQVLAPQDIALQFDNQIPADNSLKFSMEQRQNLYLIFKEAINNILKHAEATKVNVECIMKNEEFSLIITDNGKGFDSSEKYEGNGLKNFKKRAQESFMNFKLSSKAGEGTKLELKITV